MKTRFCLLFVCLLLVLSLSGCSNPENESPNGATVEDTSIFSPPEEDKGITGSWTAEGDEITINRYFYGNGNLVTIEQDPEEETWVFLSLWDENEDKIDITHREAYYYDESDGDWLKADTNSEQIKSAEFNEEEERITIEEELPNGIIAKINYKKGTTNITLPKETSIIEKINDYLMQ